MPRIKLLFLVILPLACSSNPAATSTEAAATDACTPIVHVDNASPSWLETLRVVDPRSAAFFRVARVSTACVESASLHYAWYYDWSASVGALDASAVCQDAQNCSIVVCDRTGHAQARHTVLMVVSDAQLPPTAVSPTDFPAGTAFDAIVWQLDVQGPCL